jgi:hypothetical protein
MIAIQVLHVWLPSARRCRGALKWKVNFPPRSYLLKTSSAILTFKYF